MPGLKLFLSNRLEILSEKLAKKIKTPLSTPLKEEIIVVQSRGMERWLSMQLAEYHGICANCKFPFPNAIVEKLFQKVLPDIPERLPFDPKTITWKIMNLLPELIKTPGFETIRNYLEKNEEELRLYQLSERIADTFDQYLIFRPMLIFEWEQGKGNHWQAVLWRELVKTEGKRHRAALAREFLETIEKSSLKTADLPERISVFGISALPRFHMEILASVSRFTEVNLFLMNPCREYWGDILSDRTIKMLIERGRKQGFSKDELHLEKGNTLLSSWGKLGRDFFDLVNELECEEACYFEDPGEETLLSAIQSDILNLRERGKESNKKKMLLKEDDFSIQIHSCHSPMREIEVLHDQLLNMFEKNPELMPKDILVMTPDIEAYAPYIQAVFDVPGDDSRRIPFTIADRNIRMISDIVDTFFRVLDLCGGRFSAPQVLDILRSQAVQRRFELIDADLELIIKWIKETQIRWGIDSQDRKSLRFPPFPENTWKAGIERLLLGYAMPGHNEKMFKGILPYDYIEGNEALVLGRFLEFLNQLFSQVRCLEHSRTLREWSEALSKLLDSFFMADEETEVETQMLRRLIVELRDLNEKSGVHKKIDVKVIKWHLRHNLEKEGIKFGFINGGVTFCAMLPMRSIPFKVICLVGMNGDAYPRRSVQLGFDFIARNPRPGDRSRRNDDLYLFLEALLSSREKLYISYVGQSIEDNSPLPPSPLVSELVDYIEQGFEVPGKSIKEHIVTKHRLQAFSQEYFKKNEKLFSYSEENFLAAQSKIKNHEAAPAFISSGLSEPEGEWKTIELKDLCSFWSNPARFLLRKRLGIYLEERTSVLKDTESFELEGLEKYLLEEILVERRIAGFDLKEFFPLVRALGELPHGVVGECIYENLKDGVERFVENMMTYLRGERLEPIEVNLSIADFKLVGRIDGILTERMVQYRYTRAKPKDHLRLWIYHLALNSMEAEHYPRTSILSALHPNREKPHLWEYSPVEKSRELLKQLLKRYWEGLKKPLHFFPESSWCYIRELQKRGKDKADALRVACNKWKGSDFTRGEGEDPYFKLCFGSMDPLDKEFQELTIEVLAPLLKHQKEIS